MVMKKQKNDQPKHVYHHVTRDEYDKLLEQCPDQEWRVMLALARYGGLRCPSETLQLRWADIDWKGKGIRVTSNTKFKIGRTVPLFPNVRKELEALFKATKKEKNEFVINQFPDRKKANLPLRFAKINRQAGLETIRRPFGSLRLSRATELWNEFDYFLTCTWMGTLSAVSTGMHLTRTVTKKEVMKAAEWAG